MQVSTSPASAPPEMRKNATLSIKGCTFCCQGNDKRLILTKAKSRAKFL